MIKLRRLAIVFAAASTLTSLSAFAESRHRDATESRHGQRQESQTQTDTQRREARPEQLRNEGRTETRTETRSDSRTENRSDASASRSEANRNDSSRRDESSSRDDRSYRNGGNSRNSGSSRDSATYRNDRADRNSGSYRNDESYRNGGSYRNSGSYRNDGRSNYTTRGRVTRIEHYGGGYRVYLGGGYPFFVSDAWFRLHRLRVGIEIGLGGYWNPGGYYDVYDDGYYATAGDLRGVVESIDYRRGTAVVRDDLSGSFVTIVLRGNDPRLGSIREGDYVTLGGEWSRAGVFNAFDLVDLRDGRYGRY